ncbi:hypothetical protein LSCM4_06731 [Leishmania orientalis]|uniref:Uncharacterized protein n=1 Tax=Leishmania orientalis TaxID=2249476 RepID=A0A836I036_9TRYP|nr:hypothetical protein LSCM4_06731 [Leishmania orientalis]
MPASMPESHATLPPAVTTGGDSGAVSSLTLDVSAATATAAALAGNCSHCRCNASIAVFLFAKEKLLFRYPDTDPFVVNVIAHGSSSTSSSAAAGGPVAAAAAGDASSKKASGESSASSAPSTAQAAPSSRDRQCSRGSHPEQAKKGGGGSNGSGGTHQDPDDPGSAQTPTSSVGGGVGSRLKKSSHVHVAMAADVRDGHHQAASGTSPQGGAGPDTNAPVSSSGGGVAPQRGMRRPASTYSLANDHLGSSGGSFGHGHRAGSPVGGGTAATESRRGLTSRGQPANTPGAMAQTHTSAGSMRRQLSGAAATTSSSINGSPSTRKSNSISSGAAACSGGGSAAVGGRSAAPPPQQQQQQAATTGATTCVGLAPNVLMHLLRGALCGTTTINMVNCTFLVFPLSIGAAAPSTANGRDGATGSSSGSPAPLERLHLPNRSGTALLVVAMKEPDTDAGAIANFTQCFVNILCREEHRCQYVTTELERMEMLTSHWESGGAAALASAAAATAEKRPPHEEEAHQQRMSAGGADGSVITVSSSRWCTDASRGSGSASTPVSPARQRPYLMDSATEATADSASPGGGGADTSAAPSSDYDYLFSPSRPAVRHQHVTAAARSTANEKSMVTNHSDRGAGSGARTSLRSEHIQQHRHHHSQDFSPSAAAQGSMVRPVLEWADLDDDADGDDAVYREDGRDVDNVFSHTASPSAGRGKEHSSSRRGGSSPVTTPSSPLTTPASSCSLYQQLAVHVRLAYEVLRVAQCIDVWNRTMRTGCRAGNSAGGALEGGLWGGQTNCMATCGGGAAGALREPRRRLSIPAAYSQQQQQQPTFASAGTALDTLPEALLINHMLLLPMSHLTGAERQEEAQSLRSAYARIHPCSVLTIEADQFTEQLQRRYLDVMGRRYAKLIPLSAVYALLQALPSPRRAGSFYRSLELALLEAVQRRHARAATVAAAVAGNPSTTSWSGGFDAGANTTSVAQADPRVSRDAIDEEANAFHAAAAVAVTTAAGLDFLAMEIIDFLRVNGAISVASEMYVCFTHGEVTPVALIDAAVARRRRHRLKAERRKLKAAATAAAGLKESDDGDGKHGSRCHHRLRTARDAGTDPEAISNSEVDSGVATMTFRAPLGAISQAASASRSWLSSQTTAIEATTATGAPDSAASSAISEVIADPLDAVLDMETVPAALVLHMLECVVDTQQRRLQGQQHERHHSLAVIGGSEHREETAGLPKTPNTGSTVAEAGTSLAQGWQGNPHLPTGTVSTTSSPSLHFAANMTATNTAFHSTNAVARRQHNSTRGMASSEARANAFDAGATATAPQRASPLAVPGPLSVYCAWGSACPLCELLVAHPQCWTTRSHRSHTLGYYTMIANRSRHYDSGPAIRLVFPSLDESVCTCARRARHLHDNVDFAALMQNSYTGSGSSSLLHSVQPWFMRPHLFLTPVTAAYGVSPYEVFERMSYHCNRLSSGNGYSQRLPLHHTSHSPTAGESATATAPPLAINNTSALIEPDPRDLLLISRAQAHPHETSMVAATCTAAVGCAKEQAHTLLQCADIPEAAAEYLRRSAVVIKQRLDYARRQQSLLERYEQALEQQSAASERTTPLTTTAAPDTTPHAATVAPSASSVAASVAKPASSSAIQVPPAHTVSFAANFCGISGAARGGGGSLTSSSSVPVSATMAQLSSSADPLAHPLRYGCRQLHPHSTPRPLSNRSLLFDSTSTGDTDNGADAPAQLRQQQQQEQPQNCPSSSQADLSTQSVARAFNDTPLAGVGGLLGSERSLPVEVLLQYVLHHMIALTWGKRGLEVDTLVRLLERNLRRLPPLLANLPYILQLRSAGYTSALAAAVVEAASASNTTASGAGGEATPIASSVFTAVHTRLAASAFCTSLPVLDTALHGSSQGTSPDGSTTSSHSGISHAATGAPVTEAEVQLLQAYEVLDQLSLMKLLSAYATWPVRTVPTRLLLHTVVNEFSDVLYVDSSARDGDAEHWDLPVTAR